MELRIKRLVVGPVRTNCYIVYDEAKKQAVVIDPGDEAQMIQVKLVEWNLQPVAILLTHGHFDHIGAAKELKDKYDIPIYALAEEREILTTSKNLGSMVGMSGLYLEADTYLRDNQKITIADMEFQVIATPGHTIGSCCYFMELEDVLFSGDTLFHYSHGRTDFPTGSAAAIIRSIKERLLVLDADIMVYPGHEDSTTIGAERRLYDFN